MWIWKCDKQQSNGDTGHKTHGKTHCSTVGRVVNVRDLDCKETFSDAKHMILSTAVEVSGFSKMKFRDKELLGINVSLSVLDRDQ